MKQSSTLSRFALALIVLLAALTLPSSQAGTQERGQGVKPSVTTLPARTKRWALFLLRLEFRLTGN